MKNIIVTSGESFTDIDAYACAIAYSELLIHENKKSEVVLPGVLNNSITQTIRSWNIPFNTKPSYKDYQSVIVDVSEPDHVARCAPMNSIIEIYDHRHGFEKIWKEKLDKNAHIEFVGACTTLIWEEFKKRGFDRKISSASANLLLLGTVSNTLDFGAEVTHPRDIQAYEELKKIATLPSNWKEVYFSEQNDSLLKKPIESILMDTKVLSIPNLGFPLVMGQMELWDASPFLNSHIKEINEALKTFNHIHSFMSLPSISEKKNYIYTENEEVKKILTRVIGVSFLGNIGTTQRLWLRKEVRKALLEMSS